MDLQGVREGVRTTLALAKGVQAGCNFFLFGKVIVKQK